MFILYEINLCVQKTMQITIYLLISETFICGKKCIVLQNGLKK